MRHTRTGWEELGWTGPYAWAGPLAACYLM